MGLASLSASFHASTMHRKGALVLVNCRSSFFLPSLYTTESLSVWVASRCVRSRRFTDTVVLSRPNISALKTAEVLYTWSLPTEGALPGSARTHSNLPTSDSCLRTIVELGGRLTSQ